MTFSVMKYLKERKTEPIEFFRSAPFLRLLLIADVAAQAW